MRVLYFLLLLIASSTEAQVVAFDTLWMKSNLLSGYRYRFTNFAQKEPFDRWNYHFSTRPPTAQKHDSVPPLGYLLFFRKKDRKEENPSGNPQMHFAVWHHSDSFYAYRYSRFLFQISSCGYAAQGGDVIRSGRYLLVCMDVCVPCWDRLDLCRPTINAAITAIVHPDVPMNEWLAQLPIESASPEYGSSRKRRR